MPLGACRHLPARPAGLLPGYANLPLHQPHAGLSITKDIYLTFRAERMRTGADALDVALRDEA